jgi:biotin operon repressor
MVTSLNFTIYEGGASREESVPISAAVIAGWTGRDEAALEKHIKELEELGVARPASTPIFYRVAASRLTQAPAIEASGGASSGEVEFVLVRHAGKLYVGVGSDHTDRQVETYGVTVSKQMCDKPVAGVLWAYDEVSGHWDQLTLKSWTADGAVYQDGSVSAMRSPEDLISRWGDMADGTLRYCGTLAALGGLRPSRHFAFELADPVLGRSIKHGYDIVELPVLG